MLVFNKNVIKKWILPFSFIVFLFYTLSSIFNSDVDRVISGKNLQDVVVKTILFERRSGVNRKIIYIMDDNNRYIYIISNKDVKLRSGMHVKGTAIEECISGGCDVVFMSADLITN